MKNPWKLKKIINLRQIVKCKDEGNREKISNNSDKSKEKILFSLDCTAQKMKFSIKDFFSKCDQIGRRLRIRSYLL